LRISVRLRNPEELLEEILKTIPPGIFKEKVPKRKGIRRGSASFEIPGKLTPGLKALLNEKIRSVSVLEITIEE